MFYSDEEKSVYKSPLGTVHDPVQIANRLVVASQGRFNDFLDVWYGEESTEGQRAEAALLVADSGRKAFNFSPLTEEGGVGDGAVLEVVHDFMGFLSKKGSRGTTS